jgi:hypothetical protein
MEDSVGQRGQAQLVSRAARVASLQRLHDAAR